MVYRFLIKLGIKPPYDPVTPLLGIYAEEPMKKSVEEAVEFNGVVG